MARFAETIAAHAATRPTHPAVRFEEDELDYRRLETLVAAEAGRLRARGVEPGDRVAVLIGNEPAFLVVLLGCARLGAVFVPLNTRLTAAEIGYQVAHCAPVRAVASADLRPVLTLSLIHI